MLVPESKDPPAVLCYVDHAWAYFTTQRLERQCGPNWSAWFTNEGERLPRRAGPPYIWHPEHKQDPWQIIKIGWEGPFEIRSVWPKSHYSVMVVNRKRLPWLCERDSYQAPENYCRKEIMAGTWIEDFVQLIESVRGGIIYIPRRNEMIPMKLRQIYSISEENGSEAVEEPGYYEEFTSSLTVQFLKPFDEWRRFVPDKDLRG